MKKIFAYTVFSTLLLMVSCTNELEDSGYTDPVAMQVGKSDVQIQLSSGARRTRASVESTPDGLFDVEGIGIFCLAQDHLNVNPQEMPIQWERDLLGDNWSIWMDNVKANAVTNSEGTDTDIVWDDPDETWWYPTGNWHKYQFYAYYPYQETVDVEDEVVTANISLDGTQDVIWGRTTSDAETEPYAYSAKHFRTNASAEKPMLQLDHRFMRLTFSIVAGEDVNGSKEAAKKMGLKALRVVNVPSSATLTIADRNTPANEGTYVCDWENDLTSYELKDFPDEDLQELDAEEGTGYWAQDNPIPVGQGILVPVPEDGHTLQVVVVLQHQNGTVFDDRHEHPTDLVLQSGSYEAGKSYNVQIIINAPQEIELKTRLTPWEDAADSMEDLEF